MTETLGEALPKIIAKIRDETLPIYEDIAKTSPLTNLSIMAIKAELDAATRALAEGDIVRMARALTSNSNKPTKPNTRDTLT